MASTDVVIVGAGFAGMYMLHRARTAGFAARAATRLPIGVGFGIRDAESARRVAETADAVVIGSRIIQEIEARTGGELRLSAGTLYRSIQRMIEQDLIVEIHERPAPEFDDERRRYYRITKFGEAVARAEARRLQNLVRLARASGFVPRSAS